MRFNIVPEYISCVLLALIGVYMLFDKKTQSIKEIVFQFSLGFSFIANVNNIIAIYTIENSASLPLLLNIYTNTFYYFSVVVMTTMVSITTYVTMFEGRYEERRLKRAVAISLGYFIAEVAIVLSNPITGWLFYFDANKIYHRGPLNLIAVLFLAIAVINVMCFGFLERKRMKKSFRLVFYTLPAITIIVGSGLYFFPDAILTGTVISLCLLTLFLSGQQQRARVDALTELPSREAFFNDINRLCLKRRPFHIISICLDNLKQINGQFGHRNGDAVLASAARFLAKLEPRATAYRISGVQFTLVSAKVDPVVFESLEQDVINRFQSGWKTSCGAVELRALIADIQYPVHGETVDEIVASLEYAIRIAKQDPSGKPVRFSEGLKVEFARRSYVISQMEKALRDDLFFLNIQPVYDIHQQRFTGGEVLLRLNEDNGVPISPGEFIPIAIEIGIATKLGLMVMEKVCKFLSQNRNLDFGWLSINVSSQQDEFDETVHHLEMLLEQYGVEPRLIKLEITERVLLEDLERAHATMDELKKRGVGVFLDDFGTGYSNLVNAMMLPFECVKIDKGFIRGITNNPKSCGLLQTIIEGLRSLNVITLAEGVENNAQDQIVRDMGIDRIQGYYYARPIPIDEFAWMLSQYTPTVIIEPHTETV